MFNTTTIVNVQNDTFGLDPLVYAQIYNDTVSGIATLGTGASIMLLGNFVSLICMITIKTADVTILSLILSLAGTTFWGLIVQTFQNAKYSRTLLLQSEIWSYVTIGVLFATMLVSIVIGFVLPKPMSTSVPASSTT